MSETDRRARFRALHAGPDLFVMPNAWDIGSARLLAACGAQAIATTSAGFAWTLGRHDQQVSRDELLGHVAALSAAVALPLSVDSERCFAATPAGVAETVELLADAGASGCSIEDYDPARDAIDSPAAAVERVAAAAEAAHRRGLVLTARAENHLHGIDDLDDTIARLAGYQEAGADVVYAPGLTGEEQIAAVVAAVGVPVNVLALAAAPPVARLAELGVRRVSTGSLLASTAYGAMLAGARGLLAGGGSDFARGGLDPRQREAAFGPR